MRVTLYVEGGGNSPDTKTRCRQGFSSYCSRIPGGDRRRVNIVACGSRHDAFKRFKIAVSVASEGEHCALLVDAEGAVASEAGAVSHLRRMDGWEFPNLSGHRVFLMVQAMEAWFLADRSALAAYYGQGFRPSALPGDEKRIEAIPKDDLESSLIDATRDTAKGRYHKTRHGFSLLSEIDPAKVAAGSPHAAALHEFLRTL